MLYRTVLRNLKNGCCKKKVPTNIFKFQSDHGQGSSEMTLPVIKCPFE